MISIKVIMRPGYPVFEAMVSLPRSMTSSLLALPRSCHDRGKDTMAMQDLAKANHDLGKDAKINHVLDKGSMEANPYFGDSHFLILFFFALVSIAFSKFSNFNTLPD